MLIVALVAQTLALLPAAAASLQSAPARSAATPAAGGFTALSPARILDTRTTTGGFNGTPVGPDQTIGVQVAGQGGVPASGAAAVVLNVTVTKPSIGGFLTVFPSGTPRPPTANLNFTAGQTIPNLVVARLGTDGKVSIYNNKGTTHVIADVAGWFAAGGPVAAGGYTALTPARILDTRTNTGGFNSTPIGPDQTINVQVAGQGGVPTSSAAAVVLNITVTQPSAGGFLTVFPSGTPRPPTANLNFKAGQTTPNLVVAKLGADGKVAIYNNKGTTHVIADVAGWFTGGAPVAAGGFTALSPARILDTRTTTGGLNSTPVGPDQAIKVQVAGQGGVPSSGAAAVVLNVTVTQPSTGGFLTVFPSGTPRPPTANLNFTAGQTIPNLVVAGLGPGGKVSVYNNKGTAHVIADVAGWFTEQPPAPEGVVFAHDADGRLTGVFDPTGAGARYSYDAAGNITAIKRLPADTLAVVEVAPPKAAVGAAVTVYGTNFASGANVSFNGTVATPTEATANRLTVAVPPGATSGPLTIQSGGASAAAGAFTVDSSQPPTIIGVSPSVVDPGGTVTVSGTGFDPTPANNVVSLGGTRAVVTAATATTLTVAVPPFRSAGHLLVRTPAGSVTSTSTVVTAPFPFIPADVGFTGLLPLNTATTVPVATAQKIAVVLADVTEGHRLRLDLTASTFANCPDVRLFAPGGRILWREPCLSDPRSSPAVDAPITGTYELVVNPSGADTGQLSVTARDVAADPTTPVTVDGPTVTRASGPGQRAVFPFTASSGQRVRATADASYGGECTRLTMEAPTGAPVHLNECANGPTTIDTITLPVRGSYRLVVDPLGKSTGSAAVTIKSVPPDVTGSLTVGGPPATLTTGKAGQNAELSFSAASGTRLYTSVTASLDDGSCPQLVLRRPTGNRIKVDPQQDSSGSGCRVDIDTLTLPDTGTYRLLIDPEGDAVGALTTTLTSVPADVVLGGAIDGTPRQLTTVLGQNARLTFPGSKGQRLFATISASATGNCLLTATLSTPAGNTLERDSCADDRGYLEAGELPDSGTYTLLLDPAGPTTGTTTITLIEAPADASATTTVDGAAGTVTTGLGQNATVDFPGSAGQRVFVGLSNTYATTPGSCHNYQLDAPDGDRLAFDCIQSKGDLDAHTLPADGTYTVRIDPHGVAAGNSTVTVTSVPPDATATTTVNGTPVTVSTNKPGQNATISFPGTTGQAIRVKVQAITFPTQFNTQLELAAPDGTSDFLGVAFAGSQHDTTLAAAGAYQLQINPPGSDIGSITVAVTTAPAIATPLQPGVRDRADLRHRAAGRKTLPAQLQPLPPTRVSPGTSLTGRILTTAARPLPGVTLRVENHATRTNASGRFALRHLPAGTRTLVIDGRTASRPRAAYGVFRTPVHLHPSRANRLGFTSYLPALDTKHEIAARMPLERDLILTNPAIPGFEVHIPAGATVYDADGKPATRLGITPIPLGRTPVPLPRGVQVPLFYTVQPGGGEIRDGLARLYYPNYPRQRPGSRVNFWHYDAEPDDLDGWQTYGHGTVNASGSQIIPDEGVGIRDFDGAMINIGDQPPADEAPEPCSGGQCGDPIDLATGVFSISHTDLVQSDLLPVAVERSYNSSDEEDRAFGIGSNDLFSGFLSSETDEFTPANTYEDAQVNLPNGSQIRFTRISSGTHFTDAIMQAVDTPSSFFHAILAWNGDGWDVTLADGTVLVYGDHMPLQAIRDRHGNTISIVREFMADSGRGSGNVVEVRSPNGRWLHYTYDATGKHVTAVTDNSGRTVKYGYDSGGHLTTVTDPSDQITEYGYDSDGRMSTIRDARGNVRATNKYDSDGRAIEQTLADGGKYQISYSDGSGVSASRATVTDPEGQVRTYDYDSTGFLTSMTEGFGTSLERTTTIHRLAGSHLPDRLVDPLGRVTTIDYDADGNVVKMVRAAGTNSAVTTTTSYNGTAYPNQPASMTNALGQTTHYKYNQLGDLIIVTDPLGRTATATYAPDGHPLTNTRPGLPASQFTWIDSELVQATDELGRTVRQVFNSVGRRIAVVDPMGQATHSTYDPVGRVLSKTSPLGNTTSYAYDPNGNLTSITDARNNSTSFAYDAMDRPIARTDALNAVETVTYDHLGRALTHTDRRGVVTTHSYDVLGRKEMSGFGRTGTAEPFNYESTITYGFDLADRLKTISDSTPGAGTISYDYDLLNRPTKETTDTGTVAYGYDALGQRVSMTISGQDSISYGYDNANQLISITQGAQSITFDYDADGRRHGATLPGGIQVTYDYDDGSQLIGLEYASSGSNGPPLASLKYGYDTSGRRTAITGPSARIHLPTADIQTTFDAADRLTVLNNDTFMYDSEGHLTAEASASYTWNARGQLTAATVDGSTTSLSYDPIGRLNRTTSGGMTIGYRYDGADRIAELDGTGSTAPMRAVYLRDLQVDTALTRTDAAGTRILLIDGLGSTIALAQPAPSGGPAAIATEYSYEPYGAATSDNSSDTNPIRFTGRESGPGLPGDLQHNRNRFYDPSLRRFISQDPLRLAAAPTNLYSYATGNPVNLTDPTGMAAAAAATLYFIPGVGQALLVATLVVVAIGVIVWAVENGGSSDGDSATQPQAPPCPPIPADPTQAPGKEWEWRGKPPVGGDKGNWHNPETGESLHPDLAHPAPIGPHWDYTDSSGNDWRVFPDGTVKPK